MADSTPKGLELGLVAQERAEVFERRTELIQKLRAKASAITFTPNQVLKAGIRMNQDGQRRSLFDLMAMPDMGVAEIAALWPEITSYPPYAVDALQADALYSRYIDRQTAEIATLRKEEQSALPVDIDYEDVPGLSAELAIKFQRVRPATLGQAARIEGVTPAALAALISHVRHRHERKTA